MKETVRTYRANPRGVSVFGFLLCAVLATLFWSVGEFMWNIWIARAVSIVCGLIALMLIFYKEISIDSSGGLVTETTLLFGFFQVRRRERRLSEFRGVCCYVSNESDGGAKTWAVALVPASGYPIDLRYFSHDAAGVQAEEFARELERTTGLEISWT